MGILILLHGILHVLGFTNAFGIGAMAKLDSPIPKLMGIIWLSVSILFSSAAILIFLKKENWWVLVLIALLLSQLLIFSAWKDAKLGSITNVIILIPALIYFGQTQFENKFHQDVKHALRNTSESTDLLTEADLNDLPIRVREYLRISGVVNKPKVKNMHLVLSGQMRQRGKDYFSFTSEQYNFFDDPKRFFFMKADLFGMSVPGYHRFTDGLASMDIRLFGFYPIEQHIGGVMNKTETVTFFNEMCLLAPATLIDKRIQWRELDSHSVEASFHHQDIIIKAVLYFNEKGQLINFISHDRTDVNQMQEYPFSTPVSNYQNFDGISIMSDGEAIWHYPNEKFTYGKFTLKSVTYNVKQ